MRCYLCRFSSDKVAADMNRFIEENIGEMHPDVIASEVREYLTVQNNQPTVDGGDIREDNSMVMPVDMIKEHIYLHTLNPVIRTGVMLRSLVELEEKMKADLFKTDAEGQNMGLDPKRIEAYLRLQAQQINLYKSNPTRLMFASANGGDGP